MSKPRVNVDLLADEDVPTSFNVLSKSFGHDAPFIDIYFPEHDTPTGQEKGSRRLAAWKNSSKNSTFLKAVAQVGEEEHAQTIALAVWTFMKDAPTPKIEELEDVEDVWPNKENRDFMAGLWRKYVGPRTRAIESTKGEGAFVLELLAVHPDYQGLGAGRALVEWGAKAADSQGLLAVVEGTPKGRPLYAKCGFKTAIEQMDFEIGEEFTKRRKPELIFMTREPKF